jgi:CubicO group peptidase (beta-lactamase class C family)
MKNTRTFILDAPASINAAGYDRKGNAVTPWDHRPVLIGHGGLASCAKDMLRFAVAQFSDGKGALARGIALTHDTTYSATNITTGLAWQYIELGNAPALHHTGGTAGYTSYFALDPVKKIALILLSNSPVALTQDGDYLLKRLQEE